RFGMAFFDESETRPRQGHWIDSVEQPVIRSKLSEVRDLGRAADVGQSRQQEVLNDGGQRHVRAEAGRASLNDAKQLISAVTLFGSVQVKTPVVAPRHGRSAAVIEYEQRRGGG